MQKIIAIHMISVIFVSLFQSLPHTQTIPSHISSQGVDITYEVTITAPPDAGIKIKATYSGITSPLRLQIGYENWPDPTIDILKDMQFSSLDGKLLSWSSIDSKTIEVVAQEDSITANFTIDLAKTGQRGTKVSTIGGVLSGYEVFPLPIDQPINNIKVKFILPQPWKAISFFPLVGDLFEVVPITYADLSLETKAADWYFGNVDFDQTKNYEDGFKIRVVGFKYFSYEHWDVYMGDTPLDEAFKSADFYHETYLKLKEIFGDYPYNNILLVGPGYWQTRSTYMRQQMVGWYRYEYIPHHMIHAYFGMQGSKTGFSGRTFLLLGEGYTTYSEGIMSAIIAEAPYWRGMMYERKFHYIRGIKFNNLNDNSNQDYVLGFIVTYLMDQKIRSETDGQKGIDDLMAMLWHKYNTPNFAWISDEQFLETLKELTGHDWYDFYNENMINTNHLDVDQLDNLKGDFGSFLNLISDTWYNGYPSMYFISEEIVAAAGNFDMDVRLQSRNLLKFSLIALEQMDKTQKDLTEADVEAVLQQITGKDHSDFFEFYRNQGFEIDLNEINNYVKTYTFKMGGMDNAVKLFPNEFPLGKSTFVIGELVDSDFASAKELGLQVIVFKKPSGMVDMRQVISGSGVSNQFSQEFTDCDDGSSCIVYFYNLPKIIIGDKVYTFFTINLPKDDAGVLKFSFWAKNAEPSIDDGLGGFVGTQKVTFQNDSTFNFKPESYVQIVSYGDLSSEQVQNLLKNNTATNTPPAATITPQSQLAEPTSPTLRWIVIIFGSLSVLVAIYFIFRKLKH